MESMSICRGFGAANSHRQTLNSLSNVVGPTVCSCQPLRPFVCSGIADISSQGSLFSHGGMLKIASRVRRLRTNRQRGAVVCAKDSENGTPRPQYSSDAKIRSEVIAPFRSVRMFFYGAFIASGSIGGLIATTRLIASLNNAPGAEPAIEIAKGLGIDLGAVLIFALLYRSDSKARDKSLAKLSREENLSNLRLQLSNDKVVTLGQLRGTSRIVILAGPGSYIEEALSLSDPFREALLERGVLVAAYATDGAVVGYKSAGTTSTSSPAGRKPSNESSSATAVADPERKWRGVPIYTAEWSRWLDEQKKLANVTANKPVYISLRLDGRVRGSGVGVPPWQAMSVQLPPLNGIWGGALDGMDGKV